MAPEVVLNWKGEGAYQDEVVGESHYQPALKKIAGGERRKRVTAHLVLEPDNPHDANAVRVDIGGETVGYLPADRARLHRERLNRLNAAGSIIECDAVIVTGHIGVAGVYLDLPFTVRGTKQPIDIVPQPQVVPASVATQPARGTRRWLTIGLLIALALFVIGLAIDNSTIGMSGFIGLIALLVIRFRRH